MIIVSRSRGAAQCCSLLFWLIISNLITTTMSKTKTHHHDTIEKEIRESKIDWEFKEWSEKDERLAVLVGYDNQGNEYQAGGVIGLELTDIEEVCDIERVDL